MSVVCCSGCSFELESTSDSDELSEPSGLLTDRREVVRRRERAVDFFGDFVNGFSFG